MVGSGRHTASITELGLCSLAEETPTWHTKTGGGGRRIINSLEGEEEEEEEEEEDVTAPLKGRKVHPHLSAHCSHGGYEYDIPVTGRHERGGQGKRSAVERRPSATGRARTLQEERRSTGIGVVCVGRHDGFGGNGARSGDTFCGQPPHYLLQRGMQHRLPT
eukprot:GGOE01053304.1.p1 GENE.GGOE01053304.1~~GGOE01053304.1.p1  ORF type:complete len:162 (-),score=11.67 GGOE01053304.1:54-539(-)